MRKQIIIALSGRKNAGKNTIATFIAEYYMETEVGIPNNQPPVLMSDLVLECSFADQLKEFCINTLGLCREQCYGSDDEKNSLTEYKWEDAPRFLAWKFGNKSGKAGVAAGWSQDKLMMYHSKFFKNDATQWENYQSGYMTGREVMQIVGTDLMRQTFGNIWAAATIRYIKRNGKPLNIIADNRFPNEIAAVLAEPNGYIIRLTRSPFGTKDVHPSESALDNYEWKKECCYVLDNTSMTIKEQNDAVAPIIDEILELNGE